MTEKAFPIGVVRFIGDGNRENYSLRIRCHEGQVRVYFRHVHTGEEDDLELQLLRKDSLLLLRDLIDALHGQA